MAASSSPLHTFDNQLWEQLLHYLDIQDLCQLVRVGNNKVSAGCIRAARELTISCETVECLILSHALVQNLRSLVIHVPCHGTVSYKNYPHVFEMISIGHLTELTVEGSNTALLHFTLPPTLKKLAMNLTGTDTFESLSLGEAKLSHLHVENSFIQNASHCQSLVDCLVTPSSPTLQHLVILFHKSVTLDLSNHAHLSFVSLDLNVFIPPNHFVPPPSAAKAVLRGDSVAEATIQRAIAVFGPSLVDVTLNILLDDLPKLDISAFDHIESLTILLGAVPVVCAPAKHLRIVCENQPHYIINDGQGTVSIESSHLILIGGNFPDDSVLNNLDWSRVKLIDLHYLVGAPDTHPVDYSCLRRAVNLQKLILYGDTMYNFAARNGPHFLELFPKLVDLDWEMDLELFQSLTPSGMVLPTSVTHLKIEMFGQNDMQDCDAVHMLDWIRHVPKRLWLSQLPFVSKMISMCNDATSVLDFNYVSYRGIVGSNAFWTDDVPTFAPSRHVKSASFRFFDPLNNEGVFQKLFGSYYCNPDSNHMIEIRYVADTYDPNVGHK